MDLKQILRNLQQGFYSPLIAKMLRCYYYPQRDKGVDVVDEEWDNLIVLDACRYDIFEEYNEFEQGELSKKRSKGGHSKEWLKRNFKDYYDDIVYVSGNVFVSPNDRGGFNSSEHFGKVYPVYLRDDTQVEGVTHPKYIVETALKAHEEHPDKRKIIHFMQPHTPYLGEKGVSSDKGCIGDMKKDGVSDKEIREAYISNFLFVQEYVKELIDHLEGEIVVTADHGEALGEKGLYNHHPGVYTKELVEVPWLRISKKKESSSELDSIDF
jgi:hypothetical protein